jgi:hypothetical protein
MNAIDGELIAMFHMLTVDEKKVLLHEWNSRYEMANPEEYVDLLLTIL